MRSDPVSVWGPGFQGIEVGESPSKVETKLFKMWLGGQGVPSDYLSGKKKDGAGNLGAVGDPRNKKEFKVPAKYKANRGCLKLGLREITQ